MSETHGQLEVSVRTTTGKGVSRRLRAAGRIPAVIYGGGKDSVSIDLDPRVLRGALDPERQANTLFKLQLTGANGASNTETCIISDIQRNALKDNLTHLDFVRVNLETDVTTMIPVVYTGRPVGVAKGGKLRTFRRSIKISAKPHEIPVSLVVDIGPLEFGETLRISDVSLDNARILENERTVVAMVEIPRGARPDAAAATAEDDGKKKKK